MSDHNKLRIMAILFLIIGVWTVVRTEYYIRITEPRDAAQEQCLADLGSWVQDWLQWRWVEESNRTAAEVKQYHAAHPLPACQVK